MPLTSPPAGRSCSALRFERWELTHNLAALIPQMVSSRDFTATGGGMKLSRTPSLPMPPVVSSESVGLGMSIHLRRSVDECSSAPEQRRRFVGTRVTAHHPISLPASGAWINSEAFYFQRLLSALR